MSVAQPPKLEPAFRSGYENSRRSSLRHRSPSPPSPRNNNTKRGLLRRPSLGMSLRSKSSETLLSTMSGSGKMDNNSNSNSNSNSNNGSGNAGFGSLTSSTESVCRTLRAYRKKLAANPSNEHLTPDALRELEKELKLTARVVGERSHGKTLDEAMIAKILDQASDRLVGLLDEKLKERAETQQLQLTRQNSEGIPTTVLESPHEVDERIAFERSDTAPGALETRKSSAAARR